MCIKYLLIFSVAIFVRNKADSQSTGQNNQFILNGEIVGRDTGSVMLWYFNNNNKTVSDTVKLNNGKFYFSGTINRACEALLWTDLNNHMYDDPSMMRFLLEPSTMHILYKISNPSNPETKGSKSQAEKEKWDKQKAALLSAKALIRKNIYSLEMLSKTNKDTLREEQINRLSWEVDSINQKIRALDVKYIERHRGSYLSGYLLSRHTRKLSVDSLEMYYNELSSDVKKSSIGHDVLMYVYPLTHNSDFRKANPLVDIEFDQQLSKLKSIYDMTLNGTLGNAFQLSSFKAKYVVID